MPREATAWSFSFHGKISIYSSTKRDGERTGADVAMHSRRIKKKTFVCQAAGTHFRAIHTVKGGTGRTRCCLSHLSFVRGASCSNNLQKCIVDPDANTMRRVWSCGGGGDGPRINKRREAISRYARTGSVCIIPARVVAAMHIKRVEFLT